MFLKPPVSVEKRIGKILKYTNMVESTPTTCAYHAEGLCTKTKSLFYLKVKYFTKQVSQPTATNPGRHHHPNYRTPIILWFAPNTTMKVKPQY